MAVNPRCTLVNDSENDNDNDHDKDYKVPDNVDDNDNDYVSGNNDSDNNQDQDNLVSEVTLKLMCNYVSMPDISCEVELLNIH